MKYLRIHIIIAFISMFGCSKQKEELSSSFQPETIKVYDDGVSIVTDLTPGDEVALITYLDRNNVYNFKLITNEGDPVWNFKSTLIYVQNQFQDRVVGVLNNPDGSFDIVAGVDLLRISADGELLFHQENFFGGLDNFNIQKVMYDTNGNYIIMGSINNANLNRAFVNGYNSLGTLLFNKTYFIHSGSFQGFSSGTLLPDGNVLLAGTFKSSSTNFVDSYFISKLSPEGDLLWTKVNPLATLEGEVSGEIGTAGKDLLLLEENQLVYLINPSSESMADQRLRLVYFDTTGTEIGQHGMIDFASINNTYNDLSTGPVISKSRTGSVTGIARTYYTNYSWFEFEPITYTAPRSSYHFEFHQRNNSYEAKYLIKDYNSDMRCSIRLSDEKTMQAGTIDSFGSTPKIIVFIR